jgi:DNA-binding LacI/PurR family transcriptional regulator
MASMKDVARMADVSISTVSRVISGTIPVDVDTRNRVERAIQSIGYKPNLIARGLRVKSTNLVGMLVPEIRTTSFATLIEHVEESVEALGYNLILGGTGGDPDREERFFENLIRRHIDGIIISLVSDRSHLMRIIEQTDVPVVIVDRPFDSLDLPTVVMDNFRAGALAADHLLSLGHSDLACITGARDISIARERTAGFIDALETAGIKFDEQAFVEGHFDYDSGGRGVDVLLDRGVKFTALWAQNDIMAIGALNRLRERGISVPGDVSLMGLDNVDDSWMARPSLTTIAQPYKEIGDAAARLLLKLSRNELIENHRITLSPSLVVRDSTGPVKR